MMTPRKPPHTGRAGTPTNAHTHAVMLAVEQHCRERGLRLTEQRKLVMLALLQAGGALSAYELVEYCKRSYKRAMPAMSVYRILDFLIAQKLVHKLDLANKYVACAHITCDHEHGAPQFLICSQCQRVTELSLAPSTLRALHQGVASAGFELLSPQLEINGLCQDCASASD